ncbi:hypothetical protein SPONN_1041 [uncultured Candidatus Thioglobus sp.]|nr:hypothetical protein SPONN_1041 [uncultured Candidatus Thioglobus sp.]
MKKINNIKLLAGSILAVFVILLSWKLLYSYNCISLIFSVIFLFIILHSLIEIKVHKRNCIKNCYFKENSFFAKLLTSKTTIRILYFLISTVITISVMYSIITYQWQFWAYIAVHIIIVVIVFNFLNSALVNTVHTEYLSLLSKETTIKITLLPLLGVYIYVVLNGYTPIYLRDTLEETIIAATNSIHSQCYIVDYILRLKTELDANFWWLFIKMSNTIDNNISKYFIWISFIAINGLAIVGINRFIVQIVYILKKGFNSGKIHNEQ